MATSLPISPYVAIEMIRTSKHDAVNAVQVVFLKKALNQYNYCTACIKFASAIKGFAWVDPKALEAIEQYISLLNRPFIRSIRKWKKKISSSPDRVELIQDSSREAYEKWLECFWRCSALLYQDVVIEGMGKFSFRTKRVSKFSAPSVLLERELYWTFNGYCFPLIEWSKLLSVMRKGTIKNYPSEELFLNACEQFFNQKTEAIKLFEDFPALG